MAVFVGSVPVQLKREEEGERERERERGRERERERESMRLCLCVCARETERALQFTIILEGAVIIYGQLSDSDIQLTTTCLWPVIRGCLSDSPLLT